MIRINGLPENPQKKRGNRYSAARAIKQWRTQAYLVSVHHVPDLTDSGTAIVTLRAVTATGPAMDDATVPWRLKAVQDGVADALFRSCKGHKKKPCGHYHDGPTSRAQFRCVQERDSRGPCVEIEVEQ